MERVKGYYVVASTSDRSTGRVKGPYQDQNIASMECADKGPSKGVGWYGANDGYVREVEFFQDGVNLYEIPTPTKYVDVEKQYVEEQLRVIKSKLLPEEWDFINTHSNNE